MEKLQELLDSVAADSNPDTLYQEKLPSGGFRVPNVITTGRQS